MVKLLELKNKKQRIIRETIKTPTGTITVFEPTIENFDEILKIQREEGKREGDVVAFDEAVVIRKLFPLLTDLEFGEISDEELQSIVENPSIYLLATQNIVSQIVAEVNALFMQRIKTELIQAKTVVAQANLVSMIPTVMKSEAERTGNEKALKNLEVITNNKLGE